MTDLLPLLQEFHSEKLEMLLRHQAGARLIAQYDVNNTYQYLINRDEVQPVGRHMHNELLYGATVAAVQERQFPPFL